MESPWHAGSRPPVSQCPSFRMVVPSGPLVGSGRVLCAAANAWLVVQQQWQCRSGTPVRARLPGPRSVLQIGLAKSVDRRLGFRESLGAAQAAGWLAASEPPCKLAAGSDSAHRTVPSRLSTLANGEHEKCPIRISAPLCMGPPCGDTRRSADQRAAVRLSSW